MNVLFEALTRNFFVSPKATSNEQNVCRICDNKKETEAFPELFIGSSCRHTPQTCLDCIEQCIATTLDQGLVKFIACPECGELLSNDEIWRLTGPSLFDRYENLLWLSEEQECSICTDTFPRPEFPRSSITPNCEHEPQCCRGCIATHITSQLDSGRWKAITCPECREHLSYDSVKEYAKPETFDRYDRFVMCDSLSEEPNFCWCTAPGCGSGQLHPEAHSNPLMICSNCHEKTCFTHQTPWHDGQTCPEFDNANEENDTHSDSVSVTTSRSGRLRKPLGGLFSRSQTITVGGVTRKETKQERKDRKLAEKLNKVEDAAQRKDRKRAEKREQREQEVAEAAEEEMRRVARQAQEELRKQMQQQAQQESERKRKRKEELASQVALNTYSKECPNRCGARIQKNDGCDHMTCRQCKHQFCWICFADWIPIRQHGNAYHRSDCKYHSGNL